MPVLHAIVGPNGAGKSTYFDLVLSTTGLPFVNADRIAAQRWPEDPLTHAYDAAALAAEQRHRLLRRLKSFVTETVFSHPSKVELLHTAAVAGYAVELHVILIPEQMAVHRVANRVQSGGHDVPADKVVQRFRRLWPLVRQAILFADHAEVRDNSRANRPFRLVAEYHRGHLVGSPNWPVWTPEDLVLSPAGDA